MHTPINILFFDLWTMPDLIFIFLPRSDYSRCRTEPSELSRLLCRIRFGVYQSGCPVWDAVKFPGLSLLDPFYLGHLAPPLRFTVLSTEPLINCTLGSFLPGFSFLGFLGGPFDPFFLNHELLLCSGTYFPLPFSRA